MNFLSFICSFVTFFFDETWASLLLEIAQQICSFSRFSFVTLKYSVTLSLPYWMPYHGLQFLRCNPPCITQIYLVMHSLFRDIQYVSLLFHKSVHRIYRSRFTVIRPNMHALHTQAFLIGKKLNLRKILFFLSCSLFDCPIEIFSGNKIRQADDRNL